VTDIFLFRRRWTLQMLSSYHLWRFGWNICSCLSPFRQHFLSYPSKYSGVNNIFI